MLRVTQTRAVSPTKDVREPNPPLTVMPVRILQRMYVLFLVLSEMFAPRFYLYLDVGGMDCCFMLCALYKLSVTICSFIHIPVHIHACTRTRRDTNSPAYNRESHHPKRVRGAWMCGNFLRRHSLTFPGELYNSSAQAGARGKSGKGTQICLAQTRIRCC